MKNVDSVQTTRDPHVKVTVFTPTYNRRHTLERTYRSLQEQTFKDFEWLIVDDGSTDDTSALVAEWQKEENLFPIRYHWKPNGGKHTAHNLGISLATGEYFSILDSDDWYVPDTLKVLWNVWESIPQERKCNFSNVEGLCSFADGRIVGHKFPSDAYDGNHLQLQKTHNFDTRGMYRLEVLKQYPFPEGFEGCFVPESLIWNRIAQRFNTRYINTIVGCTEYQLDGLSNKSLKSGFMKCGPAILYNREMALIKSFPLLIRFKCKANAYRYALHNRMSIVKALEAEQSPWLSTPFAVIGFLVYLKDKVAVFREEFTKVR